VDPKRVDDFDPEQVPTVGLLLRELDQVKREEGKEPNWEQTSLKPYVDMFDAHIAGIIQESTRLKKAVKAESFDF